MSAAEPKTSAKLRVFLSYSRKDEEFVLRLRDALETQAIEVFRDVDDTLPGEEWLRRLWSLIEASDTVIFVLSSRSVASDVCRKEVSYATSLHKRVYPIVLESVDWQSVPEGLAARHSVYFTHDEQWEKSLNQLTAALLIDIDWVREHTRLFERASTWDRSNHAKEELISGKALEKAEQWVLLQPKTAEPPTLLHRRYIEASRGAATARRRARLSILTVVSAVVLGLLLLAYGQRNDDLRSKSTYLAKLARDKTESGDAGTGLIIALSALPQWKTGLDRPVVPEAIFSLNNSILSLREALLFDGHTDDVNTVRFSPDGRNVLTASDDGTANIWDVAKGTLLRTLDRHKGKVYFAEYSIDGEYISTAGADNAVRVWRADTGALVHTFEGHSGRITSIAFCSNDTRIVAASADNTATIWSIANVEQPVVLRGHTAQVNSAQCNPDGTRVLTSSDDKTAIIWNTSDGSLLVKLRGHDDEVIGSLYDRNGKIAATYSQDNTARLWDAESGSLLHILPLEDTPRVLRFCPDGRCVAIGLADGVTQIWDAQQGRIKILLKGHAGPITAIDFDQARKLMVTSGKDGRSIIWNYIMGDKVTELVGHTGEVLDAKFDLSGTQVLTGSRDKTVRLWMATKTAGTSDLLHFAESVTSMSISENEKTIAAGSANGTLFIATRRPLAQAEAAAWRDVAINAVVVGRQGDEIVTGSDDGYVAIWQRNALSLKTQFQVSDDPIASIALWRKSEGMALIAHKNLVSLLDVKSGVVVREFRGHSMQVLDISISADGERMATASMDGTARIWDLNTGESLHVLKGRGGAVFQAVFGVSGETVFISAEDGTIVEWRLNFKSAVSATRYENGRPVMKIATSNDNRLLIGGSSDGRVSVWEIGRPEPVATFRGHTDRITSLAVSQDNKLVTVISAASDGSVQEWNIERDLQPLVTMGRHKAPLCLKGEDLRALNIEGSQMSWCHSVARFAPQLN